METVALGDWKPVEAAWSLAAEPLKLRHQKWTPGIGVSGPVVIRKWGSEISVDFQEQWIQRFSALGRDHRLNGEGLAPTTCLLWWYQGKVMSFTAFLRELGQLIQERAVISCVYPRLVALDTVNELAGLTSDKCGLITTSAKKVLNHIESYPVPSLLFVSEHLVDGDGLSLVRELHRNGSDQRSVLILTENHRLTPDVLADPIFASIVVDQSIGGPSCVLTQALRAVNRNERFLDPAIKNSSINNSLNSDALSERELNVLNLVAEGLSNKEVGEHLHLASTTVRDHLQSVMRKLNVNSRTGAAVAGYRQGLLVGLFDS